jgi:CheY-like chemotaxis protein
MRSRPGEGSTFTIAVPARRPDAEPVRAGAGRDAEEADESIEEGGAPRTTVLVIEDDRHSLDLVSVYLRSAGYAVVAATDGQRGLEMVRELHPAAVILDVLLPGLNGWDVLARLKSDPATAALPVIITSMLDERGHGFALGASEYLVKPVRGADIVEALRRSGATPDARRSVVVIDDDPESIALVTATLQPEGWTVVARRNGEDCVELVRAERPAVVLIDLLMHSVDGFELVERLGADTGTQHVPIVVLTSRSMSAEERRRLDGQIGYLAAKGDFDARRLGELVQRVASRRRPEEAAWPAS